MVGFEGFAEVRHIGIGHIAFVLPVLFLFLLNLGCVFQFEEIAIEDLDRLRFFVLFLYFFAFFFGLFGLFAFFFFSFVEHSCPPFVVALK